MCWFIVGVVIVNLIVWEYVMPLSFYCFVIVVVFGFVGVVVCMGEVFVMG